MQMFFHTKYLVPVTSYCFLRKAYSLQDAKISQYNFKTSKYETYPMLMTTKVCITTLHTFAGIYFWPYFLYNDLSRLELRARNINELQYYQEDEDSNNAFINHLYK
jgi:hypothetical protein